MCSIHTRFAQNFEKGSVRSKILKLKLSESTDFFEMAPWKSLEEKKAKALACKERKKQRKFEEKLQMSAENRKWEEAVSYVARISEAVNSFGDSWSLEENRRVSNEIWSDISSSSEKLTEGSHVQRYDKICAEDRHEGLWSYMFDDSKESVRSNSNSVSRAELVNFSVDTLAEKQVHDNVVLEDMHDGDLCFMFEDSCDSVKWFLSPCFVLNCVKDGQKNHFRFLIMTVLLM